METKICTKCGQELPATTEYFYKNGIYLKTICIKCEKSGFKNYYQKNKTIIKDKNKEWKIKNKLKYKKYYCEHNKKYNKNRVLNLMPSYIADKLNISTKDLTPELLEQKRLTILIKRELCK